MKKIILKSKKIYTVLGTGILICLLVLTANISYEVGQSSKQNEYSKEYLETYGVINWSYTKCFNATLEESTNFAQETCDFIFDMKGGN